MELRRARSFARRISSGLLGCSYFEYKANQAATQLATATKSEIIEINNAIPSSSTTYNITLSNPEGNIVKSNNETTSISNGAFTFTYNFTQTGLYKVQMFCVDGENSYSDEGYYEITGNGKTAPKDNIVVLFSIIFLIIVGFALYSLILNFGHFAS